MSVPIYMYIYIPYHIEWLYIQSWQKIRKNQQKNRKNFKKIKKLKIFGTISGALARSLIPIYPITLNGYIYSPGKKIEKPKKNRKNLKKLKKPRNNFWGPCQVLNMYIVAYIAARIYRGWHESQECAIFKLR